MFERIVTDPYYSEQYNITVLSRPYYADGDSSSTANYQLGPWLLTIDNFVSEQEAERLIELGGDIGYEKSTDVGAIDPESGTVERKISKGRTSTNAWCNTDECESDPVSIAVYERMENLTQISMDNYEPFQLLRYKPGQLYVSHKFTRLQSLTSFAHTHLSF